MIPYETCSACGAEYQENFAHTCEQEGPFPRHMSPSSISSLLTCGEQFRLTKLVQVPQRPMWASIGGSVVHKQTEELDREWYATNHPETG